MSSYPRAPQLARPAPVHTLTPSAEAARQAVRDYAVARQEARDAPPDLVTQHVPPWVEVPVAGLTGAPATFVKAALAAGREVAAKSAGRAVTVAARRVACNADGGVKCDGNCRPPIRVTWIDGKLSGTPVGFGAGVILDGRKTTLAAAKAAL